MVHFRPPSSRMDPYRFGYSPLSSARISAWPITPGLRFGSAQYRALRNIPKPSQLRNRAFIRRAGLWRARQRQIRSGMFREVLDKRHVRCTVSLSMSVIEIVPIPQGPWALQATATSTRYHAGATRGGRGHRALQTTPAAHRAQTARLVLASRLQHATPDAIEGRPRLHLRLLSRRPADADPRARHADPRPRWTSTTR